MSTSSPRNSAARGGGASGRRPSPVDFSRPSPLGPEETRVVRGVHDDLVERLSPMLTTRLRAPFRLAVSELEMVAGTDLTTAAMEPCVIAVLELSPLPGAIVLRIPMAAASVMIDLMLGGAGVPDASGIPPTAVEISVLRRLLDHCLAPVDDAWRPVVAVSTRLTSVTCDPEVVEDLPLADPFLRIHLTVTVEGTPYPADLWLPNGVLTAALRAVDPVAARSNPMPRSAVRATLTAALSDIPVDVRVAFPEISMTPTDILGLRRGDVLTLGTADTCLRLHVGGMDIGTVRPARNGDRTACVVLSTVTHPNSAPTSGAS